MSSAIPWRRGVLDHDGEQIYYEEAGQGPTLVLCHGAGGNHAVWYQQVAHFAPSRRVVTWDQRGYGRSTRVTDEIGPQPAVRDLRALLDHLGVGRAEVVGQSMGGWCALGFALACPDRVSALVLADSLGGIFTPEIIDVLVEQNQAQAPPEPPLLGVHPAVEGLDDRDRAQAFLYQQLSTFTDEVPPLEMVALLLQTQYDPAKIGNLDVATLFVYGSDDQLFPPDALRMAAELVPGARVAEIAGSTHSPYFEDAEAWNAVVGDFLAETAR